MTKVRIGCFALLAVVAFSAFGASSAMAETRWLVEGKTFTGTLSAETEGELTMINFASATSSEVLIAIKCSWILDGTITNPNLDVIEDLLNLEMVQIGENLEGEFLNCTITHDGGGILDCKENTLALVWVDNLNLSTGDTWLTELLLEGTMFWDDFSSNLAERFQGYDIECETLSGATLANLCEGNSRALLENATGTSPVSVAVTFNNEAANLFNCTLTGNETGNEESPVAANTWAISSELTRLATAVSDE